ncbi:Ger(x)C family spore germination protein [Paenibacillus sp. FJAT-27812]|uniref:Ger(x)C family spore germination protein n=1 Tax=Paenibacillus sp. FJAT-27812 TaxID=1684143 RepID=UPI0006A75D5B|nr:Ger(x)C family spore germination protein [Paenibacillus sp. FJAT-27812]
MIIKNLARFVLLLSFFAFLTGCWNNKDIDKRLLPVVMGIDKGKNGNVHLYLRIPNPENNSTRTIDADEKTIDKAIDMLRTHAEESIDLLHLKLLLISEEVAKDSIKESIEFAVRSREISPKALIAIVSGDFEEVMHDQKKINVGLSAYDFFGKDSGWTPNISIIHLWEAYRGIYTDTEDTAIPIIAKGTATPFLSKGSAIMNKARMVGKISIEETLIYNLYQGQYSGGTVEVMNSSTVSLDNAHVSNHADWSGSTPKLTSHMKLMGVIEEKQGNPTNDQIKKDLEALMRKRYLSLLTRLQANKSDILGIGQYFRNQMSEEQRKKWKETYFPKLKQEFTIDVVIIDSGDLKS